MTKMLVDILCIIYDVIYMWGQVGMCSEKVTFEQIFEGRKITISGIDIVTKR